MRFFARSSQSRQSRCSWASAQVDWDTGWQKKRLRFGVQTSGKVAPPRAPGQLRKGQADELLATAKVTDARFGIVALPQTGKPLALDQIQNLRKNMAARIPGPKACAKPPQISNAWHHFSCASRSKTNFSNQ